MSTIYPLPTNPPINKLSRLDSKPWLNILVSLV
uniref:Uncharacterized protein n=1 Tax=Setaria italica TaxID=4555 RepID=K3ZFV1_SETIT